MYIDFCIELQRSADEDFAYHQPTPKILDIGLFMGQLVLNEFNRTSGYDTTLNTEDIL